MPPSAVAALSFAALLAVAVPTGAVAQSADDVSNANNPLTPNVGLNFQDAYVGSYHGLGDEDSNSLLLRGTLPHRLFGQPQILRATLPVVTTPDLGTGRHTDFGDLNLFDLFLFKDGHMEVGIGPQLTLPTAGRDETGTGKWQAGLAGVLVAPQPWGLLGGLLTWQQSFAGDDDRPDVDTLTFQPLYIRNLANAWYVRSSATWSFDLRNGNYFIPLGVGIGKVWKQGTTTLNAFGEPQWTISHDGDGVPKFQFFFGLNLQFPL